MTELEKQLLSALEQLQQDYSKRLDEWENAFAEWRCHSPGCMAMQPGEIYQAQSARFAGEFTAGFTGLTPHSRRTRSGRCGQEMLW